MGIRVFLRARYYDVSCADLAILAIALRPDRFWLVGDALDRWNFAAIGLRLGPIDWPMGASPRRILVVWPIWPSIAPIRPRRPFLTFDNPSLSVVIPYGFSVIRRILCGICAVGFSLLLLCRCRSGDGSLSEALLHSGNFPSDICTSKPIRLRKTS